MLAPDAITKFFGKVQLKRDVASTATGVEESHEADSPEGSCECYRGDIRGCVRPASGRRHAPDCLFSTAAHAPQY